jgi:mannose-6-phosphate isomerase-like protein (cupin superfamily)
MIAVMTDFSSFLSLSRALWYRRDMRFEPMVSGETIRNDATGETLTMLESSGVRQLYAVRIPPHRPSPPLHYHVAFAETFTVMEGALDFYLGRGRRRVTLGPGQRVTAEIGRPHTFGNDRDEWTTFTVETRPPGGVVASIAMAYAVANAGDAAKDGLPRNLIARLNFIRISEGFLPGVPLFLQRGLFAAAEWAGRMHPGDRLFADA